MSRSAAKALELILARPDTGEAAGGSIESFASSTVVGRVFDQLLKSIHEGQLLPGQRISDSDIAEELGVSRTPVREALQRLREIGVIEASASRFTRVAIVSPQQTAQAMVVWVALYSALVAEVIGSVPPQMVVAMRADHERFTHAGQMFQMQLLATANADFFHHFETLSSNPALQRAINSVVHIIRLGSLHLPDYVDFQAIGQAQELLLAAARDGDRAAAQGALRMLSVIAMPMHSAEPDAGSAGTDLADAESTSYASTSMESTSAESTTAETAAAGVLTANSAAPGHAAKPDLSVGFSSAVSPAAFPVASAATKASDSSALEIISQKLRRRRGRS